MDEVSGIVDQLPLQLCVLGDTLASDAVFLNICRGFQVLQKSMSSITTIYH